MKKYDLNEVAYGWYVVAFKEEDLNGPIAWDMVQDEIPGEKYKNMTPYERGMRIMYGSDEEEPEFYRDATYSDLAAAVNDAPGWDFGQTLEMLYTLCGWVGIDPDDYEDAEAAWYAAEELYDQI